jgi:hypothetical protein
MMNQFTVLASATESVMMKEVLGVMTTVLRPAPAKA